MTRQPVPKDWRSEVPAERTDLPWRIFPLMFICETAERLWRKLSHVLSQISNRTIEAKIPWRR